MKRRTSIRSRQRYCSERGRRTFALSDRLARIISVHESVYIAVSPVARVHGRFLVSSFLTGTAGPV